MQKVDYSYNIRGWLTGINNPFNASENDLFSLKLYYTDTIDPLQGAPQYNGNISAMKWQSRTPPRMQPIVSMRMDLRMII